MHFNWGTGIALFYGTFVSVLLYFVIKSTGQDNSLVSEDYYAEDLKYQERYEKLRNATLLARDLEIRSDAGLSRVAFHFPEELGAASGEIHFFCPSDSKSDFRVPVRPGAKSVQYVPCAGLKKGHWKIKVDWQAGGKSYFKETNIIF